MTTFVLVHGAWGGNHSWRDFAPLLWARGHEVFAPSLTGLGERVHLGTPETDLSTHIQDVVNCIEYQDLHDIVLVGHSYGGMVVTGVAEKMEERIRHIVYEDAFLPRDGESCWSPEQVERSVDESGWRVGRINNAPVTVAGREYRGSGQPRRTIEEPVHLSKPIEQFEFTRTYVKAAGNPRPPESERNGTFWDVAARVSKDPAWKYFELPCGHGIHREMPQEFLGILLALA
jgi:pimeloyl-ACP methyl ester carboxylesterase